MRISIIAAIGKNRELGGGNRLLWHIGEDMKHFREVTTGHSVIMGQRTYESIGRALPNRTNIVLSDDPNFMAEGIAVARSIEEAVELVKKSGEKEIFVIGGARVYEQFLPLADTLYLTLIDAEFPDADVFFPEYEYLFREVSRENYASGEYRFSFVKYIKDQS